MIPLDLATMERFVEVIDGAPDTAQHWRRFHDRDKDASAFKSFGSVAGLLPKFEDAQQRGYGLFLVISAGGQSRRAIARVRACFIDMDGGQRWQDVSWHAEPDFLVIRDDTHWHAYWLISPSDAASFAGWVDAQRRLIAHYGSDPAIHDLARVMRVPGSAWQKEGVDKAILVRLEERRTKGLEGWAIPRRPIEEIAAGLPEVPRATPQASKAQGEPVKREHLEGALGWIEPGVAYKDWRNVVAAVRATNIDGDADGLDIASRWSRGELDRLGRYKDTFPAGWFAADGRLDQEDGVEYVWNTMPPREGGVGFGTIFRKARDAGWPVPADWTARESGAEVFGSYVAQPGQPWRVFDPWAKVQAPPFPLDTLPEPLRQFATDQAAKIGADPSALAMAALAVCSGAIDHRVSLNLLRNGDWRVSPRLWVVLCGDPSTKKSPVMSACTRALYDTQKPLAARYNDQLRLYESLKKTGAIGDPPEPFARFIVNDVTIEKLGDILSDQHRGVLCYRDELAGWIGQMEKYGGKGGATDRALWLESWNGGPRSIDRMSRSTFVENLSVSMLGGIQPARLAELANLSSDGLLQRFLPVMVRPAEIGQDIADQASAARYAAVIKRLTEIGGRPLVLADDAMPVKAELEKLLHELSRLDGLGDGFATMAGKLMNAFGALAIILHLAADADDATTLTPVSKATAEAAARIVREFVIPHARAFYDLDRGEVEEVRALASYVLTSERERFVPSDFTTGVRALRGLRTDHVAEKVSVLVAGGWLAEDGFPVRAWCIVPGLREHLAARRSDEIERKRRVLELISTEAELRRQAHV